MLSEGGAVGIIVVEAQRFHLLIPEADRAICSIRPEAPGVKNEMFAFGIEATVTSPRRLAENLALAVLFGDPDAAIPLADAVQEEWLGRQGGKAAKQADAPSVPGFYWATPRGAKEETVVQYCPTDKIPWLLAIGTDESFAIGDLTGYRLIKESKTGRRDEE